MTSKKFIISDQLRYEEDTAWQDWWESGEGVNGPPIFDRMIEIDPNIKPWEEEYPYSRTIKEFEASKNLIVSTTFIEPSNIAHRVIAEGEFHYSPTNTLEGGVISNYHIFIKGVDGINLYSEAHYSFDNPVPIAVADWEIIYKQITEGDFFNDGEIRDTLKPVNRKIKVKYAHDNWAQNLFGNDFIANANTGEQKEDLLRLKISASIKFNKKSADKIINFDPSIDTLEIDTDSFGIDSSASFATGKNKKTVKKKLAKQDFDFLYDEKKGGLYFNENGADKGFGEGGIIAILKGAPDLTSGNLEFI